MGQHKHAPAPVSYYCEFSLCPYTCELNMRLSFCNFSAPCFPHLPPYLGILLDHAPHACELNVKVPSFCYITAPCLPHLPPYLGILLEHAVHDVAQRA